MAVDIDVLGIRMPESPIRWVGYVGRLKIAFIYHELQDAGLPFENWSIEKR